MREHEKPSRELPWTLAERDFRLCACDVRVQAHIIFCAPSK